MTDETLPTDDTPDEDLPVEDQPGVNLPIIDDRFELIEQLGEGGFGALHRAKGRLKGEGAPFKRIILVTEDEEKTAGSATVNDKELEEHRRRAMTEEFKVLA